MRVDDGAVATAFVSERHLRVDGRAPVELRPAVPVLADGGRLGAHPRQLPAPPGAAARRAGRARGRDPDARRPRRSPSGRPLEVEETVYAAGRSGRRPAHARGVGGARAGRRGAPRGRWSSGGGWTRARRARVLAPVAGAPLLPAAGVRVLDLTRVIAGPVATRTLALLGADVLRVDPPRLPEIPDQHADTGFGKRSALLDLAGRTGRAFEELLAPADVVVTGYRPGALDRFGLDAARRWPRGGPGWWWRSCRRGARTGRGPGGAASTAWCRWPPGSPRSRGRAGRPGALPAQALDHGTGYLLAAAVLRALTDQDRGGRSRLVRLSLARTAAWLTDGIERRPGRATEDAAYDRRGPGSPSGTARWGGCGTPCRRCPSRAGRVTGHGRRGVGGGRGAVALSTGAAEPYVWEECRTASCFPSTCPVLARLVNFSG